MLTDEQLQQLESRLVDEAARLSNELSELGAGDDPSEFDQNFADTSQVTAERGEIESLIANLRASLAEVEKALAKFPENKYGKCENCGADIPFDRLDARPDAPLCIDCASQ